MVVLEGAGFCVAEDKTKGEVDFEHGRLIRKDAVQLLAEACRTDRGQAKIIPVLKSVLAPEPGSNLWPMLPIGFCYCMFSSVSGMRFEGISSGSASQLELAAAVDA